MLNRSTIMGRLTRDPEQRQTATGKAVANFTLACDRDYAKDGGDRETDFIDCTAWGSTAEFVLKYFRRGSMAIVEGRIRADKWTDKDDVRRTRYVINVENVYFGEPKKADVTPPPREVEAHADQ